MDIKFPIQSEDDIVQQYRDFLSQHPNVRIAVIDHITSVSALVMPIKKIIKVCRDHNVLSMIDGAHAPGQVQIDMKDVDPDFYAGNFHKWLYTPRGCALLYIKKDHQEWTCPLVTAGNYSENLALQFYIQGTRDDTPYVCLPEALQFYHDLGGMEKITRYCTDLLDQAASKMAAAWGTATLPVPREMEAPCMRMVKLPKLTGFTPSLSNGIRLMSDIYTRWNIQTCTLWDGEGDLYVRISANVYNTEADYDTLIAAIQKMRDCDSTASQSPVVTTFGHAIREAEFSLRKGSTFLNNAARGSIPKRVREIHLRYIDELDEHPDDWMRRKVKDMWIASRESAASFVNVDPEDLVFVQNATTGFNSVLKTYPFSHDDAFLFTNNSFSALQNTCHYVSTKLKGMKTYILDVTFPIETDDEVVEKHRQIITDHPDIKLVVVDHITSRTALMFPVHKIVKLCKEMGVMVLVDGANAPGQVPLDIKALDPDFYSGNFHKWAFAPRGCGFLYVKKVHRPNVKPLVTSHLYQQSMTDEFFMQGCRDDTPYITLKHALQFLQDIGGMEKITAYNTKLLKEAVDLIVSSWGTHTLPIPTSLEAPCVRMIKLPVLKDYEGSTVKKESLQYAKILNKRLGVVDEAEDAYSSGTPGLILLYFCKGLHEDASRLVNDVYTQYDIQTQMFCVQGDLYLRLSAQVYNELDDYRELVTVINNIRK